MRVETTEQFDSLDVAERFARAVDHTLELISNVPTIGRRRFPDWANTEVRSFAVQRPFNRFLVFYSIEQQIIRAVRLIEGHRREAAD